MNQLQRQQQKQQQQAEAEEAYSNFINSINSEFTKKEYNLKFNYFMQFCSLANCCTCRHR